MPNVRAMLAAGFVAAVALWFWTQSRYPALRRKATSGGEIDKTNPLGFEAIVHIRPEDAFAVRFLGTSVNWMWVNRWGMGFGLVVAAGILTLLQALRRRAVRSSLGNTALGAFIGAPLGLCANCAAPVASAVSWGGGRIETSLAATISSPTLNVIVIAMVASLFPPYMLAVKLAATAVAIFVVVPVVARLARPKASDGHVHTVPPEPAVVEPAVASLRWVLVALAKNLWVVVRRAVPLMVLAGAVGALAITLLPWDALQNVLPGMRGPAAVGALAGVAVFGVFMPLPMAFDVVMSAVLYAAGLPVAYVMVLLFTLGVFSVYPFALLVRTVSWRLPVALATALALVGVAAGAVAGRVDAAEEHRLAEMLTRELAAAGPARPDVLAAEGRASSELQLAPIAWEQVRPGLRRAPLTPSPRAALRFTELDGRGLGFGDRPARSVVQRYILPFIQLGGIASGDVHNDGRDDVLLAHERGVELYANTGGRFERQRLDLPWREAYQAGAAAFADLDGDGWLDIVFSVYRDGVYVVWNDGGELRAADPQRLWRGEADLVNALTAGDPDADGDVDLVLGTYTAGMGEFHFDEAFDVLLRNEGDGTFAEERLPGIAGLTLSTLLSDLNLDGTPDLFVGNDFGEPDTFYVSRGQDWLQLGPGAVEHSGLTTMSLDTADVDNDGTLELYVGQVGEPASEIDRAALCARLRGDAATRCREALPVARASLDDRAQPEACRRLEGRDRVECLAYGLFRQARSANDATLCEPLREAVPEVWHLCGFFGRTLMRGRRYAGQIPSLPEGNVLLARDGGRLVDRAAAAGVRNGGWTWNAKFADLDNDGWQDLFVANGWPGLPKRESNVLYRNTGGTFVDATEESGLGSYLDTFAYTYIDMDDDGDLDVVTLPSEGPPVVYRNESGGTSVEIELDAGGANHFGTSAIVQVVDDRGVRRMREVKVGGGYLSFDPQRLHVGLGDATGIREIHVLWPGGEKTTVDGPLAVGTRYHITR